MASVQPCLTSRANTSSSGPASAATGVSPAWRSSANVLNVSSKRSTALRLAFRERCRRPEAIQPRDREVHRRVYQEVYCT